jgi:hypothetical protein
MRVKKIITFFEVALSFFEVWQEEPGPFQTSSFPSDLDATWWFPAMEVPWSLCS